MKILIIDDEKILLDLYRDVLVENGFEVVTTTRGQEGIELARSERPDIILLDILMPEVNGFDVAKELKTNPATRDIPIYLLTNLPEDSSEQRVKELGIAGYMMKANTEPTKLAEAIRKIYTAN